MKLTKTCLFLSAMTAMLVGLAGSALAATDDATFRVNATVKQSCQIAAIDFEFGEYDPLATSDLDVTSSVLTVTCSTGSVTQIGLSSGTSGARNMVGATTGATLPYELYRDIAGGAVWGNTAPTWRPYTALDIAPHTVAVYGRIVQGLDRPVDTYSQTITATINF